MFSETNTFSPVSAEDVCSSSLPDSFLFLFCTGFSNRLNKSSVSSAFGKVDPAGASTILSFRAKRSDDISNEYYWITTNPNISIDSIHSRETAMKLLIGKAEYIEVFNYKAVATAVICCPIPIFLSYHRSIRADQTIIVTKAINCVLIV